MRATKRFAFNWPLLLLLLLFVGYLSKSASKSLVQNFHPEANSLLKLKLMMRNWITAVAGIIHRRGCFLRHCCCCCCCCWWRYLRVAHRESSPTVGGYLPSCWPASCHYYPTAINTAHGDANLKANVIRLPHRLVQRVQWARKGKTRERDTESVALCLWRLRGHLAPTWPKLM